MTPSTKMSLKLLIDKNEERVLFAEAGKDFIDFLFNLLTVPIGSLLGVLDDNIILEGGLPKLYQSVKDLDQKYINPYREKDDILKPKSSLPYVLLPLNEQQSTVTYKCTNCNDRTSSVIPRACNTCGCKMTISNEQYSTVIYRCLRTSCSDKTSSDVPRTCYKCSNKMTLVDGGFVNGMVTYMVMDDLAVSPMSTISTSIACLHKHNIKDVGALEEKVVYVGKDEGMQLLKNALTSKTVLTNVFLGEVCEDNKPSKRVKTEDNTPLFV
nr:hypothetical protein [Tanacetum cinerariifolium]